ncbi:MAG TPA: hypothetical protein VE907_11040 [Gammaproteobacteria bacterium]|nr:hypothetical protein [Gammaproteobacteria bacterium]
MKTISRICAALVALSALGSTAAQSPSTNIGAGIGDIGGGLPPIGAGADTIGVPGLSTPMPPPVPGIGVGMPSFGESASGDCPFGMAILCIPLPGGGIDSRLPPIGGSFSAPGRLVPGVINVPPPPGPFAIGSSPPRGLNTSTIGGTTISGAPIGGSSPGLINSLVPPPFDPFGSTPGSSPIGGAAPIGGSAAGSTAPLPGPGAGGSGAGSSPSGPSSTLDPVFCTPDQVGCL